MTTLVVDLYDSGVLVSNGDRILAKSESFALIESDSAIVVGDTAKLQAHIRPREVSTNFWGQLSSTSNTKHVASNAELAFKHLENVWKQIEKHNSDVILAIPNTFNKHDLGLLLGICKKIPITVIGIINKAVLALHEIPKKCGIIYLDILQQQIVLTEIAHKELFLSTPHSNLLIKKGIQSITKDLAKLISKQFVSQTRFDPLHIATDEQQFYDKLPMWLQQLESTDSTRCTISTNTSNYSIVLHKQSVLDCDQTLFNEISSSLMALSHEQQNLLIICSPACIQIFGLLDYLTSLPGCAINAINHVNLAKQALSYVEQIRAKDDQVHYTTSLTLQQSTEHQKIEFNPGTLLNFNKKPTHVLVENHAFPLSNILYIDHNRVDGVSINSECGENSLCKITVDQHAVSIESIGVINIAFNGSELIQPQSIQIGDRLHIDDNDNELIFISVN